MQETGKNVCYHGDVFHAPANNWGEECQGCGIFKLWLSYGLDLFSYLSWPAVSQSWRWTLCPLVERLPSAVRGWCICSKWRRLEINKDKHEEVLAILYIACPFKLWWPTVQDKMFCIYTWLKKPCRLKSINHEPWDLLDLSVRVNSIANSKGSFIEFLTLLQFPPRLKRFSVFLGW